MSGAPGSYRRFSAPDAETCAIYEAAHEAFRAGWTPEEIRDVTEAAIEDYTPEAT